MNVNDFMNPDHYEERKEQFKESIIDGLNIINTIEEEQEQESNDDIEQSIINLFYESNFVTECENETLNLINDGYIVMQFNEDKKAFILSKEYYNSAVTNMAIYAEDSPEYHIKHFLKKYFNLNKWDVEIKTII
jgi:hypothetical protein